MTTSPTSGPATSHPTSGPETGPIQGGNNGGGGGGGGDGGGGGGGGGGNNYSKALREAIRLIKSTSPGMPHGATVALARQYMKYGDMALAVSAWRGLENYDRWFAGNRRADGTVRMGESQYQQVHREFRSSVAAVGVNPDLFEDDFVRAIRGEASPREVFAKINEVANRVIAAAPEIKEAYARLYGLNLTTEAILASALSPKVSESILGRRIGNADVAASASVSGYTISRARANRLREFGVDWETGRQVFGQAAEQLPLLAVLQRRHDDPDDDFDLNNFLSAAVFEDPVERRRIRNLLAAEQGMFSDELGSVAMGEGGELSGYRPR